MCNNLLNYNLHYVQNITNVNDKNHIKPLNENFIIILYMNCRSLNCKLEEIQNLIVSVSTDQSYQNLINIYNFIQQQEYLEKLESIFEKYSSKMTFS